MKIGIKYWKNFDFFLGIYEFGVWVVFRGNDVRIIRFGLYMEVKLLFYEKV